MQNCLILIMLVVCWYVNKWGEVYNFVFLNKNDDINDDNNMF